MRENEFINIMISSRNNANFDGQSLIDIRKDIQVFLNEYHIFNKKLFDVWINENATENQEIWNTCLEKAKEYDICMVLYNGEAGWSVNENDKIGICHAELQEAIKSSNEKVYIIDISLGNVGNEEKDKIFNDYIRNKIRVFMKPVSNIEELNQAVNEIMYEAIKRLMQKGIKSSQKALNLGEMLEWKKMNYDTRIEVIINSIMKYENFNNLQSNLTEYIDNDRKLLFKIHSIPDSVSISAAKERVGQPFLNDFQFKDSLNDSLGPIHMIGCYKNITESQVRKIMGFPDLILIKDEFGIYVADKIYKIQMVFLEKCVGETETLHAVERFFDWLNRSGEVEDFIKRADDRREIVLKIAEKME